MIFPKKRWKKLSMKPQPVTTDSGIELYFRKVPASVFLDLAKTKTELEPLGLRLVVETVCDENGKKLFRNVKQMLKVLPMDEIENLVEKVNDFHALTKKK